MRGKREEGANDLDSLIFLCRLPTCLARKTSISKTDFFLMCGLWNLYVRTRDLKWQPINRDTKASSTKTGKHLNMAALTFLLWRL